MRKFGTIILLSGLLTGCVAKAAVDIVSVPVHVTHVAVDAVVPNGTKADAKKYRKERKAEKQAEKEQARANAAADAARQ